MLSDRPLHDASPPTAKMKGIQAEPGPTVKRIIVFYEIFAALPQNHLAGRLNA